MSGFPIHTTESAPAGSRPHLEAAQAKYGMVPNLIGALAEAPAAVEAYLTLGRLVGQTSFTPEERHVVWFTINAEHECTYCMAAHSAIAKGEGIDDAVVETARQVGKYDDPRLEKLREFTLELVQQRGWAAPEDVESFLAAGFTRQQVLEIVTIIAHKVMSNYTNHLVETPVDGPFAKFAWSAPLPA